MSAGGAEGGEDFGDEKTPLLKNTDDQDDDEQMADRTQPFQPSASSTPYNGGEKMEMKTTHQEHPGLPSFDETTFSGRNITDEEIERRLAALRNPRTGILDVDKVDENRILLTKEQKRSEIVKAKKYIKTKYPDAKIDELKLDFSQKRPNQIVVIGPKGGETKVFLDDGTGFTKKFLDLSFVKKILGKPAEVVIKKQSRNIQKMRKDPGADQQSLSEQIKKRDSMEERLNQTKTLDEMEERYREMDRQKAKYEEVMQDKNTSPSAKQAAQEGWDEINEEQSRLQPQIEERARARPLLERVKEIFKKYGVTVASVLLAAGVTIGVVVSTVTNALKASTKALGKGLKDIGAKLGSLLPGLIGSIANFLFKAAGQAIGFLAEHTWLLILAVVAFLFEKNLKERR